MTPDIGLRHESCRMSWMTSESLESHVWTAWTVEYFPLPSNPGTNISWSLTSDEVWPRWSAKTSAIMGQVRMGCHWERAQMTCNQWVGEHPNSLNSNWSFGVLSQGYGVLIHNHISKIGDVLAVGFREAIPSHNTPSFRAHWPLFLLWKDMLHRQTWTVNPSPHLEFYHFLRNSSVFTCCLFEIIQSIWSNAIAHTCLVMATTNPALRSVERIWKRFPMIFLLHLSWTAIAVNKKCLIRISLIFRYSSI